MNYSIFFPFDWNSIDPLSDNIDVCVRLEDGRSYTFVVTTPTGLTELMKKDGLPYLKPGLPFLVVERITEDIIQQLILEYLDTDDVYLKIYGTDIDV